MRSIVEFNIIWLKNCFNVEEALCPGYISTPGNYVGPMMAPLVCGLVYSYNFYKVHTCVCSSRRWVNTDATLHIGYADTKA